MPSYLRMIQSGQPAAKGPMQRNSIMYLISLIMLGASLPAVIGPAAAEAAGPLHVEVVAKRFAFQPAEITVRKGQPVDLVLKSGDVAHGLRVRELNIDIKINKGATGDVSFTPDKVGTFVGHCSVFCGSGHGQMTFTIHVVD